jgi:peptidyl-prolyl cis-trans isomerase B (cyclophilin B)
MAFAQTGAADSSKTAGAPEDAAVDSKTQDAATEAVEETAKQPDPEEGKPVPPADTMPPDTAPMAPAQTPADTGKAAEAKPRTPETKPEEPVDPAAPYKSVTFAAGEKPRVMMETSMGNITIELWPDVAPNHVKSFVYLINKGFYDSLMFHRVVPGFVIQGGDPEGTGMGGPGYQVPAEFSTTLKHEEGTLSMARSQDPNSAGSQFFLCVANTPFLDGKYTIFGKIVEGLDVIHKIEKTPAQRERPVTPVYMTKVSMMPKS